MSVKEFTGRQFGKLIAIKMVEKYFNGSSLWLCKCDCLGEKLVINTSLLNGHTKSCGCLAKHSGNVNLSEFYSPTLPETAYILGLLWADGSLQYNSINLEVVREDFNHFYPIFQRLGTWKTRFRDRSNRKPQGQLFLANEKLACYLKSLDYLPNSTLSCQKVLNQISEFLHKYFLLGLIDGDGCWYINNKNYCYQHSITSNKNQNWDPISNLLNSLEIKHTISRRSHCSQLRITGIKNLQKLGNYLYNQDEKAIKLTLPRKYNKWLLIPKGNL